MKIFILEDMEIRILSFRKRYSEHDLTIVGNTKEAIRY